MDYASCFDQLVKVEPIDSNELEKLMLKLIEDASRREHAKVSSPSPFQRLNRAYK